MKSITLCLKKINDLYKTNFDVPEIHDSSDRQVKIVTDLCSYKVFIYDNFRYVYF